MNCQTTIRFNKLEQQSWSPRFGKDINDPAADYIQATPCEDFIEVTLGSQTKYGGALVTCIPTYPDLGPVRLPYQKFEFEMWISKLALRYNRCFETDLKASVRKPINSDTPLLNVADGSAQINMAEGGMWQIDKVTTDAAGNTKADWIDTGFKVTPVAETWIPIVHRHKLDFDKNLFSFLSIEHAGTHFDIPTALQNQSFLKTNWALALAVQFQLDCNDIPAAYAVRYRNVNITLSDQPL